MKKIIPLAFFALILIIVGGSFVYGQTSGSSNSKRNCLLCGSKYLRSGGDDSGVGNRGIDIFGTQEENSFGVMERPVVNNNFLSRLKSKFLAPKLSEPCINEEGEVEFLSDDNEDSFISDEQSQCYTDGGKWDGYRCHKN